MALERLRLLRELGRQLVAGALQLLARGEAAITGTDASGWGTGQVAWLDGGREEEVLIFTRAERRRPINFRELRGCLRVLELWGESGAEEDHRMGGKPGYVPPRVNNEKMELPHPVPLNLYDPFGWSSKKTDEQKADGLIKEINNGRLAMIAMAGMVSQELVTTSKLF